MAALSEAASMGVESQKPPSCAVTGEIWEVLCHLFDRDPDQYVTAVLSL